MYVPLHTKSEHSWGYGTTPVELLLERAVQFGCPAMALTDVENLYGQVRFHHAARAAGVKPITGVELRTGYGRGTLGHEAGRMVLLARDRAGYELLCRIISRRRASFDLTPAPLVSCDEPLPGVFYLSDDPAVLDALRKRGIPPGDMRFLLHPRGVTAPPTGIAPVAVPDVVMLDPDDHDLHRLLMAIRTRRRFDLVRGTEQSDRFLVSPDGWQRVFARVPAALAEAVRLADACSLELTDAPLVFPNVGVPEGRSALEHLTSLCRSRLTVGRGEGRWSAPLYDERLDRELAAIGRRGFAPFFLVAGEIAAQARQAGTAIAGRGSAAGSLVSYLLGFTRVDPVERGLYFERFIHSERTDLPDIDIDVASDRRDQLIDWMIRRYGPSRVAMVSTHLTYGLRSAFREGLKGLGLTAAKIDRFCERLPPDDLEGEIPLPLPLHWLEERFQHAVPLIKRLIGRPHHLSVHPGGVVIGEPDLQAHTPLERAPKGVMVTQYDKRSIAELGLVKLDLLGNRALAAFQETERWVGRTITTPDRDRPTLETLREAGTIGCFQIETPAMRAVLKRLPIAGKEDLTAALAIVRPGPASGEAKAAFIRRANGEEAAVPPHPRLRSVLSETRGLLLYEEDLIGSIAALTGWSLEQSDVFRASLIEGEAPEARATLERQFLEATATQGVESAEALPVWRQLQRFAAYSFNKAHAASYAELAWQAAGLKSHYPAAFACSVLNHYGGHYPLRTVAADFIRMGVSIKPPHVNHSDLAGIVGSGVVRVGLATIKHLTMRAARRLLSERPFESLPELIERVPLQHRELEALVWSGACDGLTPCETELYPFVHEEVLRRLGGGRSLSNLETPRPPTSDPKVETYVRLVRVRNELQYLGLHLSFHPMALLRPEAVRAGATPIAELNRHQGESVRIAGLVAAARRLVTRGGEVMQFVTFEDETGLVETVLFPQVYAWLGDPVTTPGPFLVGGQVEVERGDAQVVISEIKPFHERGKD